MSIRVFAGVFGVVFVLAGLAGFVPGLSPALMPSDMPGMHGGLTVTAGSRLALGLFPVNVLHDLVHLGFGVWGLLAARSVGASSAYAKAVAVIYAALTVLGLIPVTDDVFGLVPIYGNDIWLHAALGAVAAYFGFVRPDRRTAAA